jgi:1-acyl-sn-glycerol-3-phosphate acyltransferase
MSALNSLIRYLLSILMLFPMYSCAILAGLIYKPAGWHIMASWNRLFLKIFGVKVSCKYEKQDMDFSSGGVVIGLTQQSILDPIIGIAVAPKIFMSIWNIEYALIPFVGWVSWLYGWVIVRQWPRQAKSRLKKAENYIREGGLVYLSIEGRRSKDGSLNPFKKGPVVLAIQSQANIFPVIVHGSKNCLPYGEWKIRPGEVTMKFLKPFSTEGMNYEDRDLVIGVLYEMAKREMQLRF